MREIKFRVWNKIRKVMSYDVTLYANRWVECVYVDGTEDKHPPSVADHFLEVMQFTGLKDKNGKEIYEGDIIHSLSPFFTGEGTIHDYDDDYYEVVWMEEEARFCLKKKNGLYAYVDELIEPTVKGNIFENPEILEEQHG